MSAEQLDRRVLEATAEVAQMKRGHQTTGELMGVGSVFVPVETDRLSSVTEKRLLSDGTTLIQENEVVSALARELPIGGVVGVTQVTRVKIDQLPEGFIDDYEMLGVKVGDSPEGSVFWVVIKEGEERGKQGKWVKYYLNESLRSEKEDVIDALVRMFSPNQGIEAYQIFSALFAMDPGKLQVYEGRNLSGAGCLSHDKPKNAIPANMLLGAAVPYGLATVSGNNSNRFLRLRTKDFEVSPLANASESLVDDDHLLRVSLLHESRKLAGLNITGMGGGTSSMKVLEAVYKTAEQLPDLVGNGAGIGQTQKILRANMGVR